MSFYPIWIYLVLIATLPKTKIMKTKFITLFAIVTTIVSCNTTKKAESVTESTKPNSEVVLHNEITDKYWKLIVLDGQPVTMVEGQSREAFMTIKSNDKKVTGFGGCNNFFGDVKLEDGNRIKFSTMGSTMMACDGVTIERTFLEVLEQADNYTIANGELSLNIGRRAPLAVFKAVEMK